MLGFASLRDWRTRRVSDRVWVVLVAAGLLLLALDLALREAASLAFLILVPPAFLFLDLLWDRGEGRGARASTALFYGVAAGGLVAVLATVPGLRPDDQGLVLRGLGVLVVFGLGYLFYYLGLLRGGADAKAFMALGLLMPGYPELGSFPLLRIDPRLLGPFELLFPFALATLLTATLLLLALPLAFLLRNAARGDLRWPQAFLGYRAPLDALPPFVWVLEEPSGEGVRRYAMPRRRPEEVDLGALRRLGLDRVWVTPQIPFLVPLTVGFLVTFLVGNPLFALA